MSAIFVLMLSLASAPMPPSLPDRLAELLAPRPPAQNMTRRPMLADRCCKHCSKGQPCGNSCISRDKSCHAGRGCAC